MNDRIPVRWLRVAFTAVAAALVASSVMPLAGQVSSAGARVAAGQANGPAKEEWIQLFNGRDLADWTAKFAKHDLGVNLNDTFRAEDGLLRVRYDKWTAFNNEFGHLFYKQPFSYLPDCRRVPLRRRAAGRRARVGAAEQRPDASLA